MGEDELLHCSTKRRRMNVNNYSVVLSLCAGGVTKPNTGEYVI